MPFDLTLTPLYRLNGQEQPSLPGLMATVPPRKAARGRDQDRLIVYLLASGNAALSTGESVQLASRAAVTFYDTPGTMTSALRAAAESVNKPLYDRNVASPGRGQYAAGLLALLALRESQLTVLLSGPLHAYVMGGQETQHIFDTLSGRGLGLGVSTPHYFTQLVLHAGDRILICAKTPVPWELAVRDVSLVPLQTTRQKLLALTGEDVSAVLMQATEGNGRVNILRPVPEEAAAAAAASAPSTPQAPPEPEPAAEAEAHTLQPSAYAIPAEPAAPQPPSENAPAAAPDLYSSLPRAGAAKPPRPKRKSIFAPREPGAPREPSAQTRQAAKTITKGLASWRAGTEWLTQALQRFMPRLLPGADQEASPLSTPALAFIAVLVPLVVVTIASLVYFRYGRSVQYEEYLVQAKNAQAQAVSSQDVAAQREAWQRALFYLDKAESYNQTGEADALRKDVQQNLDRLQGIVRLQFQPILSSGFGVPLAGLAASENDVYALDGQRGGILHVALTNSGFQRDDAFSCEPGSYGNYTVGPMVDLLAIPTINTINATVIGIDGAGNLLYCAPGQVPQATPLPPPDTNWGRVKAMAMDAGNLYVLDAQSRAVWVYVGKDGTFVDRPYFFFGGQIPELGDAIDIGVSGDDLSILHADGHLSTCSYSRLETVPTRCVDPAPLVNPLPAYRDVNIFTDAHFTQLMFSPAPDSTLLLLDSDSQGVFRFAPRSLELQAQLRPTAGTANPVPPPGPVAAMTVSPNFVFYYAVQDRIYFATYSP